MTNLPGFWTIAVSVFTAGVVLGGLFGWKMIERHGAQKLARFLPWPARRGRGPVR